MKVDEIINTVQVVPGDEGPIVQLDLNVWEEVVNLLKGLEDDDRWDALLADDRSQTLLEQLADDALSDIEAGYARPMAFTVTGEISPAG
jgi:hypothetical protein